MRIDDLIKKAMQLPPAGEVLFFAEGAKYRASRVTSSVHYPGHLVIAMDSDDCAESATADVPVRIAPPDQYMRRALCIDGPLAGEFQTVNTRHRQHLFSRIAEGEAYASADQLPEAVEVHRHVYELLEVVPGHTDTDKRIGLALVLPVHTRSMSVPCASLPQPVLDLALAICRANGATF